MNEQELKILDQTKKLWNSIILLDEVHPDDINETKLDIHRIQNRIMARSAQRELKAKEEATHE